jgi:hypothetical protein
MKDGRGYYISADGSLLEGNWTNDKMNGRGRIITTYGGIYEGEWKNG